MTLAMLNMRIANEASKGKEGTTDGRCYNVRSQNKTKWEIVNINRLQKQAKRRRSSCGLVRGVYSKEEMKEYEEVLKQERIDMTQKRCARELTGKNENKVADGAKGEGAAAK